MLKDATSVQGYFLMVGVLLVTAISCGARRDAPKQGDRTSHEECCRFEKRACRYEGTSLPVTEKIVSALFNERYDFCRGTSRRIISVPVIGDAAIEESASVPYERDRPKSSFEFYPPEYKNDRCQIVIDLRTISGGYEVYLGHGAFETGCIEHSNDAGDVDGWRIVPISRSEP